MQISQPLLTKFYLVLMCTFFDIDTQGLVLVFIWDISSIATHCPIFFFMYFLWILNFSYWWFWWEAEIEKISIYGDFDAVVVSWALLLVVSLQFFQMEWQILLVMEVLSEILNKLVSPNFSSKLCYSNTLHVDSESVKLRNCLYVLSFLWHTIILRSLFSYINHIQNVIICTSICNGITL